MSHSIPVHDGMSQNIPVEPWDGTQYYGMKSERRLSYLKLSYTTEYFKIDTAGC